MLTKEQISNRRKFMSFLDLEFEHIVRELLQAIRRLKKKPQNKESQLGLFRTLQSASLHYNRISRTHGLEYNNSVDKLNKAAEETNDLLQSIDLESDILQAMRHYSDAICKRYSENNNQRGSLSRRNKASKK